MQRHRKRAHSDYCSDEEFDEFETPPSVKRKQGRSPGGGNENSLGVLTKKFVNLIQSSGNKCIDLNDAVKVGLT